jgi:hypothetical protein
LGEERKFKCFFFFVFLQARFFGEETDFLNYYYYDYYFVPAIFVEEREFGFFLIFYCGFSNQIFGG